MGLTLMTACPGGGSDMPDAGPPANSLNVLTPPSESIGLAFGARTTLRVQYLDDSQHPVEDVQVSFAIAGNAAGSALSNRTARTDGSGIARVDLVGGAARASFRVVASASGAPPATFYITVSDVGFAALAVTPRHVGTRTGTTAVEARLYPSTVSCASLDATSPPQSPFPLRTLTGFDQPADWFSLPPTDGYSVLSWAHDDTGNVIATGCVDLAQHQLIAGGMLVFDLPVVDVAPAAAISYHLTSLLDLTPQQILLVTQSPFWKVAACPYGTAQLVLDCAIDALDGGDPLDCVVTSPGASAQALQAKRGAPDSTGCRPAMAGGVQSLDAALQAQMTFALAPGAGALKNWLFQATLASRLVPAATSATHHLLTASLGTGGNLFMQDLGVTARPVLDASAVLTWTPTSAGLAQHGFTLRLGDLLATAFTTRYLVPAGVTTSVLSLGTAAVAKTMNATKSNCDAVSYDVCPLAALPADCLTSACNGMLPVLDAGLARPFTRLTATGLDLQLAGAAALVDANKDGVAEALMTGIWSASLKLDDGTTTPISGTFTATSP